MTDTRDIVDRLRDPFDHTNPSAARPVLATQLMFEAGDEIERLRDVLEGLTRVVIAETENRTFDKPAYDMTCDHIHDCAVSAREALLRNGEVQS